jgi:hypothetical protein
MKDYLGTENARNKEHAQLYADIIRTAFGDEQDVLVGHHLTFETHGDINTENEIPAADTLMFDHDVMHRVFGGNAHVVMTELANTPTEERDAVLARWFYERGR